MRSSSRSGQLCAVIIFGVASMGFAFDLSDLSYLTPGRTAAPNALWMENPVELTFGHAKNVVVAEIPGPAEITMIHFAMPATLKLGREVRLLAYWDGEATPSVDTPLVDFFCDPAGQYDQVDTALVNKRRGFNCYFPMPFRKSAKIELVYDGDLPPGPELISKMPCYSYVMFRTRDAIPMDRGYFHSCWRQEALPLGLREYLALDATGKGKFIGWNVTVRKPGSAGYPVDMNEKFYIDGENSASVEFQGIEDSFGFSWGFPETDNVFPLTGYRKFFKGAAAYRFFIQDSISFESSLKVLIGFGEHEHPMFREMFGKEQNQLQLSSTVYWYQTEPHAALPVIPSVTDRQPAPDDNPTWPFPEQLPTPEQLKKDGVCFHMRCGRSAGEVIFAEEGFSLGPVDGNSWEGWVPPIYHCRSGNETLSLEVNAPVGTTGKLRLFIQDPDQFQGGRKEEILVDGRSVGTFEGFKDGQWVETPVDAKETEDGKVVIQVKNLNPAGNAVVSIVEWVK